MGLQCLFMDDNAPCHRTLAAEQLLESRRLAARTLPPVTIRELRLALFNGPHGRQGCVLARTVEFNQVGRFDGNESVADSFRSGAVSFKTHVQAISRGFFPSYVCQKNPPVWKAKSLPGVTLSSTPFLSDKYHPCKF
ncbi:hypothetical protein TNCV_2771151 [Trichonephila clavipes]|nr:hypothetical protein TNCV_2771151 [Trichonephila clavipes]